MIKPDRAALLQEIQTRTEALTEAERRQRYFECRDEVLATVARYPTMLEEGSPWDTPRHRLRWPPR